MESDGRQDSASGELPPWAAAFDPAANLQVLSELQRKGLEAARQLVERFAGTIDGRDGAAGRYPGGGPSPGDDSGPTSAVDGLIDLWAELAKGTMRAVLAQVAQVVAPAGGDGAPGGVKRVVVDRSGQQGAPVAATEIWLHNESQSERRDLRPHCGELRSADGVRLSASVVFEPPRIDRLPGRSSQGLMARVREIADDAIAGTYRGVVLVDGLPDVWLTLEVVVSP